MVEYRRGKLMNDRSLKSKAQTLKTSRNATSLPESVDGATHCNSQGGNQLDLFGQEVHPVSPSQSPEIKEDKMMNATSGLTSSISSASANLQSFLASKLPRQLEQSGSMIYKLTWKQKVTPRQWQYCQLVASAHRTKGNDSSSWPTPMHTDGTKACNRYRESFQNGLGAIASTVTFWPTPSTQDNPQVRGEGKAANAPTRGTTLGGAARMVQPWATPTVRDYKNTGNLENYIFGSPTGRIRADSTSTQAYLISHWPSPIAVDYENSPSQEYFEKTKRNPMTNQLRDAAVHGMSIAETESTVKYQLNPRFSLWLMGYPIEWAYCGERVTPSSRKSQRKSSKR